jgi:hypothetical protein
MSDEDPRSVWGDSIIIRWGVEQHQQKLFMIHSNNE